MPLYAPSNGGFDRQLPEAGMHAARCVVVIDLGTHTDKKYLNDKGKHPRRRLVQLQWELPGSLMTYEGKERPMMATKRYTLSSNEKASLRKDLESWYAKKFDNKEIEAKGIDVEKLLGRPATLNISHSEDGKYANVSSVNPAMKGVELSPQVNASRFFCLDEPDAAVWATLSQKTRDFIREAEEVQTGRVVLPGDPAKAESEPSDAQETGGTFTATDEDVPF